MALLLVGLKLRRIVSLPWQGKRAASADILQERTAAGWAAEKQYRLRYAAPKERLSGAYAAGKPLFQLLKISG